MEDKGDVRQRYGYKDLAIKDYEQALAICNKVKATDRADGLEEKIKNLKK